MSDLLDEREQTHGKFSTTAHIVQHLKDVVRDALGLREDDGRDPLSWQQVECLESICLKMARIIAGNPNFPDHWRDIRGYASERLVGIEEIRNVRDAPKPR